MPSNRILGSNNVVPAVESPYGSGEFYDHIAELAEEQENVVVSKVPDRDAILGSIKEFLSTGR